MKENKKKKKTNEKKKTIEKEKTVFVPKKEPKEQEILKNVLSEFQTLMENFEFEYVFTFLPLKEIVQAQRISKIFSKTLCQNEFWSDLGVLHYAEKRTKNAYSKITQMMQSTSLFYFTYLKEENIYFPKNISFFNDKQILKILHDGEHQYKVLTKDHKLYNCVFPGTYKDLKEKYERIFEDFEDMVDFSKLNGQDDGIICNTKGEAFYVQSFEKSTFKKITSIHKFVKLCGNKMLSEKGELFTCYSDGPSFVCNGIKSISIPGAINTKDQFNFHDNDKLKFNDVHKVKGSLKHMVYHHKENGFIQCNRENKYTHVGMKLEKEVNHSKNLAKFNEEIVDFFKGFCPNVLLKTKSGNFYFHGSYPYSPADLGIKKLNPSVEVQTLNGHPDGYLKADYFCDFPADIIDVVIDSSLNNNLFVVGQPVTDHLMNELEKLKKKYVQQRDEEKELILTCKNCKKNYLEKNNFEESCRYHPGGFKEIKIYGEELDVYSCCGDFPDEIGCKGRKHI
jgi:hypothetical protein